ncbi:MAG TPA: hypothetical protein VLE21_00715 [Candidatus Nitrosocosmicus sp.]|nr:hypothetical protein [Candidatus Nitrosocosmicus sp.]
MLKFSIMVAILLVSVGLYSSNMNLSYAQNNALSQSGNSEAEQAIEQAQSSSQDTQCVSGEVTALSCNNLGLQVQSNGDDDDNGGENPPNPPDDRCSEAYVWDVTTTAEPENGDGVPVGTIICFTTEPARPGTQPALVVPPTGDEFTTTVNPNQFNDNPNCNGNGQHRAEVTSGDPPQQLQMGDPLCVQVDLLD